MFPRHGSTFSNLAQKQGKFIPMVKTSDIKKQFLQKMGKLLWDQRLKVFFFFLDCETKKLPFSQFSNLDFANPQFFGWSYKQGKQKKKKDSNFGIICFPKQNVIWF
jgi:hypothetical protein